MANTADDVVDRLVAQSVGVAGTNLFSKRLPNSPDTALYVRMIGGKKEARGFGENNPAIAKFPDLQIVLRGATVDALDALADAVRAALNFKTWTANGRTYFSELQYEPVDLGEDENQRQQLSMVFRMTQQ